MQLVFCRFDATSIALHTFSYRADMISATANQTQTYEIISLKNGSNVLVFDGGVAHLRAYLPVQSNSGFLLPKTSISPLKQTYYIGDIVCFESNLNGDESSRDRWTGDDGMYVDSKYGIGQMISDGERHLHLKIDGQTITSERFQVQVPNEVRLQKGTNNFLYDGEEGMIKSKVSPSITIFHYREIVFISGDLRCWLDNQSARYMPPRRARTCASD